MPAAKIGGVALNSDVVKIDSVTFTQDPKLQKLIGMLGSLTEILINGQLDPDDSIQLMDQEGMVIVSAGCCVASCDFPPASDPLSDGPAPATSVTRVILTPPSAEAEKAEVREVLRKWKGAINIP